MTRPTRIAIATLSVLLAGSIALLVWLYVSDRAAAAEWALRDQERVAQTIELVKQANYHRDKSAAYKAEAELLAEDRARLAAELATVKEKRRTHTMPATLRDCKEQLVDAEAEIALHLEAEQLDAKTITALNTALLEQTSRADLLEQAWLREQDRADGWREYSRKNKRRDRVKLAFTAIGAGTVAGLAGYGIGKAQ